MELSGDIYKRIIAAKIFIDDNFSEPIDLDTIAQQAYLSRFHFHRLFSRVYRHTPHQYLTRKRMDRAKILLADNRTVADTCREVGFESLGSFSSLFKKEIGYAPTYFRNLAWLKKQEGKEEPRRFVPFCFIKELGIGG